MRSKRFSWMTRSSLAWVSRLMSPISSRNSVPPSAASNLPSRRATAPVNAPFSWPNSSLSTSSRENAAQLTRRTGRWRAGCGVDRARDQFLAGARLAAHQHRHIGRRNLVDSLEDAHHRARPPDHVGKATGLELHLLDQRLYARASSCFSITLRTLMRNSSLSKGLGR